MTVRIATPGEHAQRRETLDQHLAHPMAGVGRNAPPDQLPPPNHDKHPLSDEE